MRAWWMLICFWLSYAALALPTAAAQGVEFQDEGLVLFWTMRDPQSLPAIRQALALAEAADQPALLVNTDSPAEASQLRPFLVAHGITAPTRQDSDGALQRRLGVQASPALLVLEGGQVAWRQERALSADELAARWDIPASPPPSLAGRSP